MGVPNKMKLSSLSPPQYALEGVNKKQSCHLNKLNQDILGLDQFWKSSPLMRSSNRLEINLE